MTYDYRDRDLVIATKHRKEEALSDLLIQGLGVHCVVPKDFDTDVLGAFSGEVERELKPLECARAKCHLAMQKTGIALAVASEGSFGMHPKLPWIASDEEILLFTDAENQIEVAARLLSTDTNYAQAAIDTRQELHEFARNHLFPAHGLILKPAADIFEPIYKGIQSKDELDTAFKQIKKTADSIWVETDMRANFNPTRMKVIRDCGKKLIESINSQCPGCGAPGFVVRDKRAGLPCSSCGMPTRTPREVMYQCSVCKHEEWKANPEKETESPQYCQFCNP